MFRNKIKSFVDVSGPFCFCKMAKISHNKKKHWFCLGDQDSVFFSLLLYLVYVAKIWLNYFLYDHHLGYITKSFLK
jgi:hypothetical protein